MKQALWAVFAFACLALVLIADTFSVTGEGEVAACNDGHAAEMIRSIVVTALVCGTVIFIVKTVIGLIREKVGEL